MFSIRNQIGRSLTALSIILGIFGGSMVFSTSPAFAESSSALTAEYPWPHNGCTAVTDRPFAGVSFTYACNHHDGCYAGHWASRETCDAWFRNDMFAACREAHLPFEMGGGCASWTLAYYEAVRIFGQKFYDSNGAQVRISTPMKIA
jgi:Prokaryotic phospholipase A2